jgi:hypothetical protein
MHDEPATATSPASPDMPETLEIAKIAKVSRLPRRDDAARARLQEVGRATRPVSLAHERALALGPSLAELVPRGSVARGSVVRVAGVPGAGVTALGLELAAACTKAGEWVAAVDPTGSLGALAAREAGVVLERFAVVRRVPPARWAAVVAALLDGVTLVLADLPAANSGAGGVSFPDARRLVARARERETVLVVGEGWPADAALTLYARGSEWVVPGDTVGEVHHLTERRRHVQAEAPAGVRDGVLASAG